MRRRGCEERQDLGRGKGVGLRIISFKKEKGSV